MVLISHELAWEMPKVTGTACEILVRKPDAEEGIKASSMKTVQSGY